MEQPICQSCAMPLTSEDMYATEKDGSVNKNYCKWCYKDGEFVDKVSMEEYIEMCSKFGEQAGMTNEQMKEYCTKVFPTLKRWKKAQWQVLKNKSPRGLLLCLYLAGPAGYKQCAVVASDRALGEPGSNPASPKAREEIKKQPYGLFSISSWLGKIKQALTIYKEDIRQRLEDYDPESK